MCCIEVVVYVFIKKAVHIPFSCCSEIIDDKAVLDLTTSEEKCVVHFFHEDFRRCAIIDVHLKVSLLVRKKNFKLK